MKIALLIVALLLAYACGGAHSVPMADAADYALNTVTDVAQPMYEMSKAQCSAQEWAVVGSDRTPAQKEAAVEKIRQRCDEVFQRFETLIQLQTEARTIVDAARRGEADALVALTRTKEVQALLAEVSKLVDKLRSSP